MTRMAPRKQQAFNFYSVASRKWIEKTISGYESPKLEKPPVAGVVPHAGWQYSGAVAAKVFYTIKAYRTPRTFIIFGTVHHYIHNNAIYSRGAWSTPFGEARIDESLAQTLLDATKGFAERNESAHDQEHSVEVQMPFIKYFFPQASIVPISVLPDERAHLLGRGVAEAVMKHSENVVVIGTTDLTHYGDAYFFARAGYGRTAHEWMKGNDARIIDLALALKEDEIVPEANANKNACGAGALAATVSAAKALGSSAGTVIDYTTSFDVAPEPVFRMAVGYAGLIF
jgi:AmmeMemoRadiSam system protein B